MLITIEREKKIIGEKSDYGLNFPTNYKNIFEELCPHQIYEKRLSQKEGLNTNFYATVSEKK
jgi:hypothetical protein